MRDADRVERAEPSRPVVVAALGFTQILGYGSSYYLPAVLAVPISADTQWPLEWVIGGVSIGLLCGGLASAPIGRAVDHFGGRPVLALGSLLLAGGLVGVGMATHLYLYLSAWCVVGLGMGAGLYDVAFATLGRSYGGGARGPITAVTLFGGFASTICWPLSAYLVATFGWRWTCFAYAAAHLLVALPLHARIMPGPAPLRGAGAAIPSTDLRSRGHAHGRRVLFLLVATSLSLAAVVTAIISVHLLALLQERGYSAAAAVAAGALIGPSQVAGRLVELVLAQRAHPLWSAIASALLMAIGIGILALDIRWAAIAIVIYAAGGGVSFVVRGTLPLALFGSDGYGTLMGRLALPSLIGQAAAPWLAAVLLTRWDASALLASLLALSLLQVAIIAAIFGWRRAPVDRQSISRKSGHRFSERKCDHD